MTKTIPSFLFALITMHASGFVFSSPLHAAQPANDGGYLFATFRDEKSADGEQIYFALSENGTQWTALNESKPALVSPLGEKGARDPYLLRASDDSSKFYLIATDLSIYHNHDWKRAVRAGSRSLLVWESDDLVRWTEPRLVKVAPPDAGCTWAPEAIYDTESKRYLVYWASTTKRDNFEKHRILAAWTKDFRTFSEPFIYIEKSTTVIDTDIVRVEDGKYYRFTKDEKFKAITMEVSEHLIDGWRAVPGFSLAQHKGYEGPACYRLKSGKWCLLLDAYAARGGYKAFVIDDITSGNFQPGENFEFPFRFRHGSVLPVSGSEYNRLKTSFAKNTQTQVAEQCPPTRIVLVGDSTVCNYQEARRERGWGMFIEEYFTPDTVKVINLAAAGRSTKTFITEGRWEGALKEKPDYVLIQFGHNDSHDPKNRESTNAATDYKKYLRRYIDDTRSIGATPILVTPMVRRHACPIKTR